ncbi:hypothetical protein JX265_010990 [Neoarthrinium moseri]|uniref:Rhodopsin domain-containing protein n=1 Tax=Neoarthrinium moseri TaxID=1658444 RepID=A0A9P9WD08_9PEZI|nr:uncharacterized protein JN550_009645 [Neoarthrinium moseri]KAI1851756.1 hypothetical protein JX266_003218 [Neoarthrinium moseri]KAI1857960.1 hypothetical protein JX265_010990 [Neoarthrinium moseri]KAI1863325.1 hypothetical protein JN550_009645 [Neoarthrinium moseri]
MSGLGPDDKTPDMTQGPALLAVSVTTTAVALLTSILRFCVRLRINRSVVWDDYFLGLAMLLGLVGAIFTIIESVNQERIETAIQFDYLSQPWLNMGSTLSKVSICLFFLRLVSRVKAWRIVLGVQVLLLLLVNLAYSFTTLLQCRPMEKLWDASVAGECWNISIQHGIGYFQGAFDVFSGLFIALFPMIIIQDLNIKRNIRWPFYILSGLSIVIAMLAVVRTYNISLTSSNEQFQFQVLCTIMAVLEQNLGILSANMLPIASLFSKHIRPISQAISEAASARDDSDAASILSRTSKASKMSKLSRRKSNGSNFIIEGPQRDSYDTHSLRDFEGVESWPMGIIKTVSVQVTEEDAPDAHRGMDISEIKRSESRQDWDSHFP